MGEGMNAVHIERYFCINCGKQITNFEYSIELQECRGIIFPAYHFRPRICPYCKKDIKKVIVV